MFAVIIINPEIGLYNEFQDQKQAEIEAAWIEHLEGWSTVVKENSGVV